MSFTRLWDAGFTHLVSVTRPDAAVHPNSQIKAEDLGKAPGKPAGDGRGWWGYNWRGEPPLSRQQLEAWEKTGANVGLNAGLYPGLDIDVSDEVLAQVVMKYARQHLGAAPVRLSREPRRLMVYRAAESFGRMELKARRPGEEWQLIELLAEGQQYLVHGLHPKGMEYRWDGTPLWDCDPERLTPITREDAARFFDQLAAALASAGLEVSRGSDGSLRSGATPQSLLEAPSPELVREVVDLIPNPAEWGWHDAVRMGHAVRAACGEENEADAQEIYEQWLDRWEGESSGERPRWESLAPPHSLGFNWLQEQASLHSNYNPAQDDFEADPTAGPAPAVLAQPEARVQAVAAGIPADDISLMPGVELSDEWAADQIYPEARGLVRFIPGIGDNKGVWRYWNGSHWATEQCSEAQRILSTMIRRLAVSVKERGDNAPTAKEGRRYIEAATRMQNEGGIKNIIRRLQIRVSAQTTHFDVDPWLLCTPGGVVDLRSGEVHPSRPEAMHSRCVAVAPAPGPHPLLDRFLADLTGRDKEYARYLQKFLGYCLTGKMSEKVLAYAWGSQTDTGKSTIVRLVMKLWGSYADSVDVGSFVNAGKEQIPADIARLPGVRLVTASEPEAGKSWDEKRVKQITGEDEMSARFLYGQWFTYKPQFKILIVGNNEPELRHVEEAMLRRLRILPMNNQIPRSQQIPHIEERMITEEGPAIMQWLLEGCLAWQKEGLQPPEVVATAIEDYWNEQDALAQWFEEECIVEEGAGVHRQELYEAFAIWCRRRGEQPCNLNSFRSLFRSVANRYGLLDTVVDINGSRRKGYRGVRLKPRVALGTADFGVA